jgi:hypothetical protein
MESLRDIRSLEILDLPYTKVGNEGLRRLEGLPNLKLISTGWSKFTAGGIGQFQRERPGVRILP